MSYLAEQQKCFNESKARRGKNKAMGQYDFDHSWISVPEQEVVEKTETAFREIPQCSLCTKRTGHNKSNCPWGYPKDKKRKINILPLDSIDTNAQRAQKKSKTE